MRLLLLLAAAAAGTLTVPASPAEPCPPAAVARQLEERLQGLLADVVGREAAIPSAVLHVEAPALCLSWSGAAGTERPGGSIALQADRTFRVASNTKTYTAAAVLRLMEEGRLELDDLLVRHLSPRQLDLLKDGGYDTSAITIRHLLTHTAGLRDHGASGRYLESILANPRREWTRHEQLEIAVEDGPPLGPPAGGFSYSDTGYVLLGGLVEDKTGVSLGAAFRQLLRFEALGLTATWTEKMESRPPAAAPRAPQFFGDLDTTDWDPSMDLYGGGGIVTSSKELALFLRALFEGRVFRDAATFETMLQTQPVPNRMNYRIGIFGLEVDGHPGWGHTGFWNTFAFHFPDLDVTVAGSINQQQAPGGSRLAAAAVRQVLAVLP